MNKFKATLYQGYKTYLSLLGKRTVGARALVIRDNREILLVKHTYLPGWYTVGGGVDKGESGQKAAVRELYEEAGVVPRSELKLFGFYHNPWDGRDDYIALYVCSEFIQEKVTSDEIEEIAWFPLDDLPAETTPATQRRVVEYLGKEAVSDVW